MLWFNDFHDRTDFVSFASDEFRGHCCRGIVQALLHLSIIGDRRSLKFVIVVGTIESISMKPHRHVPLAVALSFQSDAIVPLGDNFAPDLRRCFPKAVD